MVRAATSLLCALAVIAAGGCGTIYNMDGRTHFLDAPRPEEAMRVFGGVRIDAEAVADDFDRTFTADRQSLDHEVGEFMVRTCIASADLLLSAAGDTLTLPITVTVSSLKANEPTLSSKVKEEIEQLRGWWHVVSTEAGGTKQSPPDPAAVWLFREEIVCIMPIIEGSGDHRWVFTVHLDPSRNPKWIDLVDKSHSKEETRKGIYERDGDRVVICLGESGKDRPIRFLSPKGSKAVVITLALSRRE